MLSCRSSFDEGPRTPSSSSPYRPHTSSPLSEPFSPSPSTSAAAKLQSRRLAQYKSITTPTARRRVSSAYHHSRSKHPAAAATTDEPSFGVRHCRSLATAASSPGDVESNNQPRDVLLRDRLRQRCAHRAQQAHTKRVERERRRNALSSSDGEGMDVESDEEDNEEELVLNDELFRRIIDSAKHKQRHSYRLSFQYDVGSSIDPDMEDVAEWERNLQEDDPLSRGELNLLPSEFDEEEIAERAAEAEEAELWADFDDSGTVFGFSDVDDVDLKPHAILDDDVDMA